MDFLGDPEAAQVAAYVDTFEAWADAKIARLRARVLELEAAHEDASGAVRQERERCAKLVETMGATPGDFDYPGVFYALQDAAKLIRGA